MHKCWLKPLALMGAVLLSGCTDKPESLVVEVFSVSPEGSGETVGKVYIHPLDGGGIHVQPALHDLPRGQLVLQVHELPSCAAGEQDGKLVAALAAGSAYHPQPTGDDNSDLPLLVVDDYGIADLPVETLRFNLKDLHGRSLVVHAGDESGADSIRIACGTVQSSP